MDDLDLSRREFMQVGTVSLLATGASSPQLDGGGPVEEYEFQGVALLVGPGSARPAPGSEFFDNKEYYGYIYQDEDTGSRYSISQDGSSWTPLNYTDRQPVFSADDLPNATSGTHTLDGSTVYVFNGFVTSTAGLDISNGPVLLGRHGAADGFIHTGTNTAITGSGGGFFARNAYFHAPGGTLFDISAPNTTEMLVESVSFSDAAGLGNITSLGTIDGYRVPSFKGCNFEDFDGGLTFDGDADKVLISNSPIRGVTASSVDLLTLASTSTIPIVSFRNNYIKDVQSDTDVWTIESGGEPAEVFQYTGNTHDPTVTKSNILTGPNASLDVEPFWVTESYPLRSSGVQGEMHNDNVGSTVTINSQNTYTTIDISATLDTNDRVQKASNGQMKYVGSKDIQGKSHLNISFYGSNGDQYRFAITHNTHVHTPHTSLVAGRGQNTNLAVPVNAVDKLVTNDTLGLSVKNESAANDLTIQSYTFGLTD